jgi:hypothetical protein
MSELAENVVLTIIFCLVLPTVPFATIYLLEWLRL